jgi:hypothetical protein
MLIQAAWNAIRTKGRLQARYSRLVRRSGGEKNPERRRRPSPRSRTPCSRSPTRSQERSALPGPGRGLLHPPGITRPAARLPRTTAPEALSRLRHHHHYQPAGGRLNIHGPQRTLITAPPEPPPNRHPGPPRRTNQRDHAALATVRARVRCRMPTGTQFPCQPGPRPADRFAGQPAGVSRFAGQAGTQARPYARTTANQRKQGRTTTYILPADYSRRHDGRPTVMTAFISSSSGPHARNARPCGDAANSAGVYPGGHVPPLAT